MPPVFHFHTAAAEGRSEFRDRGSRFLGFAYPVKGEDEIKTIIRGLKEEHPKAVHHCFAWRLGTEGTRFRAGDDGEPSGSAGKPMLGQIDRLGLTDTLVVVVRYFGGVLLGVPGLINAYRTAAAEALEQAGSVEKAVEKRYTLRFDYTQLNEVMRQLRRFDARTEHQDMGLFCTLRIALRLDRDTEALAALKDMYQVGVEECTR
jgi:uncharacterized YigZ family protein